MEIYILKGDKGFSDLSNVYVYVFVYLFYQLNGWFPEKHCLASWSLGDNDNEWTTHPTHLLGYFGGRG